MFKQHKDVYAMMALLLRNSGNVNAYETKEEAGETRGRFYRLFLVNTLRLMCYSKLGWLLCQVKLVEKAKWEPREPSPRLKN